MDVIYVDDIHVGIVKTIELLYTTVDKKTVLFLSGGKSPKPLYETLAKEKKIMPAAIALIDERYGKPMHDNSNEKMIRETGLLYYCSLENIPQHFILQNNLSREETAQAYDEVLRNLIYKIPKSIAILGIGADGHTAGIAPNRKDFTNPLFMSERKSLLVSEFNDSKGPFKERITLTFQALSMVDYLILLVFGKEKRLALHQMENKGSVEEVPARFYTKDTISKKTILITDQKI